MLAATVIEYLTRNWALVVIVLTIATLVIVPTFVFLKYVPIALNIMRSTKDLPLARNPLDFERLSGEHVSFSAYDGVRLTGMLIPAAEGTQRRGMILFAHEFGADLYSCARYCRPLRDAGYEIFTFDFRGHGQSGCDPKYTPRQWVTEREVYDMRGALAYVGELLRERGHSTEIGVMGVSRGACAAILSATECDRIVAMVCDGVYSTDNCVEYFMRRWAYIFAKVRLVYENHHPAFWRVLRCLMLRFAEREFGCKFPSVRKALMRLSPRPIAFIHGERDSYLPIEQGRLLYALAPQPKSFWAVPRAKHNQAVIVQPERYARLTIELFNRYLAKLDLPASPSAQPREMSTDSIAAPPPATRSQIANADESGLHA
ncbi:MAG: alpha/beta hydrolase [Phycisphaerae bacterium]